MTTPAPGAPRLRVFYSYSHKDELLRDELNRHLALLERQGLIDEWHDRDIEAGTEWKESIADNLEQAEIILLLVSADFIASDYCYEKEMRRALERHESGSARVIPVILRACAWHQAPFGKLQALPTDGKPITSWANRDEALTNVERGIRDVVASFAKGPKATNPAVAASPSPPPTDSLVRTPDSSASKAPPGERKSKQHDPSPKLKKKQLDPTQIIVALVGAAAVVLAAVIGVVKINGCNDGVVPNGPEPHVEIAPPVIGRVIESDLVVTVNFAVKNLGTHEIWVDVGRNRQFSSNSILRSSKLTSWDRAKPSATITARDQGNVKSGFVRVRIMGSGSAPAAVATAPFTTTGG